MTSTTPRVWLISGANTGLGLELSLKAVSQGEKVVAAVRTPSKIPDTLKHPDVKVLAFDLAWDQEKTNKFAVEAFAAFGRLDVVVNMAGYAYTGAIEESTDEDLKAQYDINVFGCIRVIRAVLPTLRAQGSGTIVNMSSLGGIHSFVGNGLYCSTKFAIEGLTFALADEIAPFGLRALVVQPGYFRTEFLKNPTAGMTSAKEMKEYEGTVAQEAREMIPKYNGKQPGDPVKGAARMWEGITGEGLAKGKKLLLRVPLGKDTGAMLRRKGNELIETADEWEDIWSSTDIVE